MIENQKIGKDLSVAKLVFRKSKNRKGFIGSKTRVLIENHKNKKMAKKLSVAKLEI